ncbi:dipeptidase 1-like [Toxorhynchites rutilus septentrionalis]|uniref:dipeptidase 1-like n=1 Tax=Toxorhynchites rutilus septentrionalis TaxID=329112 RepID=UPI00247AEC47|nr:dipeptidase 1-like [Toxorhynchites rutilus septentrionalis]
MAILPFDKRKVGLVLIAAAVVFVSALVITMLVISFGSEILNDAEMFAGRDVLDEVPLIDGHNDLPFNIYKLERNLLTNFDLDSNLKLHPVWGHTNTSHTDLPRMRQGKLGAQFWVAYIRCAETQYRDAVARTMEQIDVAKRIIARYPNDLKYVTTSDGIMDAFHEKKIASLLVVEGGHSIDSRLAVLRMFYELGVRYMTLTHSCNLPWADASPIDEMKDATMNNLSTWGRNVLWEMNRLGMMVDISHVSYGVMKDAIEYSKAPVIFSHSSSYAVYQHHRNVHDDVLAKMVENGGIVMVNFYPAFVGGKSIDDVVKHLNHIKSITGPNHIGIGGDYDGVADTPEGMEDVSKYPELFDALAAGKLRSGEPFTPWTRSELRQLAGLNLLRVFKVIEQVRDQMIDVPPYEDIIPYAEFERAGVADQPCMSDMNVHKE